MIESEKDNKLVEAEFSRDYGFNKCHYSLVLSLNLVKKKDFFLRGFRTVRKS